MTAAMNSAPPRLPLWLKLSYSAFMAVLILVYSTNYGPTNFLYFCDMSLIIALIGVWLESPLLVSMPTVVFSRRKFCGSRILR